MIDDQAAVAVQLERPLRAPVDVVSRCHLAVPVVTAVPPVLDDGTPFPTRYWLTCPLASRRIGRLESAGGVKSMERRMAGDEAMQTRMTAAHARYAAARDSQIPADAKHRPSGGVAGLEVGVKCLHAHYADHRAGNDNPVGELVEPWIEPLDCQVPCVITGEDGEVVRNPRWFEPK